MASNEDLKKIAIKCMEDDNFRIALEENPIETAAAIGITLSPEEAKNIQVSVSKAEEAGTRESKGMISSIHINM